MKKTLLLSIITLVTLNKNITAQENTEEKPKPYMGYVEVAGGIGYTAKSNKVYNFHLAYNSIVKEKYLIGLNYMLALEPNFIKAEQPNHVNSYALPYVNFGYRTKAGKVFITPSVGLGNAGYNITQFGYKNTLDLSLTNQSLEVKKEYEIVNEKQIAMPVNLNILFTGKFAGIGLDFYMIASKYTEIGTRLNICLGRVKK